MQPGKFMKQSWERDYSKSWAQPGTFVAMMQAKKEPMPERPYPAYENYRRSLKGEQPYWIPFRSIEVETVWPDAIEEHPVPEVDGFDWWGVDWVMEPNVGGMITRPGTRTISDFANWKEELEWPDISGVDFETDGKKLSANYDPNRYHQYECVEGMFERLHELIPFDESLLAFYEEPELLEEFFAKMIDYKIETTEKLLKYYGRVDGVCYHDDWGTEKAGFFSNEMFREQIMPQTKRYIDFLHANGLPVELHSCGRNTQYVPEMIEMGIDAWMPQYRCNDIDYLFDTYGDKMSFTVPLNIPANAGDDEIREIIKAYVERYGVHGNVVCSAMIRDKEKKAFVAEELFKISFEYYNKKYGR